MSQYWKVPLLQGSNRTATVFTGIYIFCGLISIRKLDYNFCLVMRHFLYFHFLKFRFIIQKRFPSSVTFRDYWVTSKEVLRLLEFGREFWDILMNTCLRGIMIELVPIQANTSTAILWSQNPEQQFGCNVNRCFKTTFVRNFPFKSWH